MAAAERQQPVAVVLETAAGPLLALVDPARWAVRPEGSAVEACPVAGGAVEVVARAGGLAARGVLLDGEPPALDPVQAPLTGAQVAALRPAELAVVADGWTLAVRQARLAPGADLPALDRAAGQAAVLRALAGDVPVAESPTWTQFVSVVDSGLIGAPVRALDVPDAPGDGTPLGAQLAQRDQVLAVVGERREGFLPAEEGSGVRTPPRVFAGLTVAAALVLTGCGTDPSDDDRRCVTGDGTVVDDDLCDDDDGVGGGGFFFIYGGSTYIRDGKTYVRGGSTTRPSGSFGSRSGSGGG